MDSITYLPDPAELMTMVNIITHHTRFTTDVVKLAVPMQATKYDLYDRANDRAARLALVDCFDDALRLEIEEHLPDDPTFHILWMMLVQIVQSNSMGKFTQMTNEIKQQTPAECRVQCTHLSCVESCGPMLRWSVCCSSYKY